MPDCRGATFFKAVKCLVCPLRPTAEPTQSLPQLELAPLPSASKTITGRPPSLHAGPGPCSSSLRWSSVHRTEHNSAVFLAFFSRGGIKLFFAHCALSRIESRANKRKRKGKGEPREGTEVKASRSRRSGGGRDYDRPHRSPWPTCPMPCPSRRTARCNSISRQMPKTAATVRAGAS